MNLKQIKYFLKENAEEVFNKLGMSYENFGDNIYSTCPVHESSDNPRAFSFCKKRGIWKCWTRECQNQYKNDLLGLIIGSLSNANGSEISFVEALSWIKKHFNIIINQVEDKQEKIEYNEFDQLISNLKDDILFPQIKKVELNLKLEIPSSYFLNRGFLKSTLEYFEVGDCIDKNAKLYDRAIIPIHDETGNSILAYICRSTKEYKLPKFLIYPKGFDKRFCLYNMHRALPHIKDKKCLFIVEGQGDVWKLYEAGVYNVVGMFGKVLTKEQQKRLQQLPLTHIIILTDNDQAGRESKIQLQRQLGRFYKLTFPHLSHKDIGDMSIKQIKQDILSQIRG